MHDLSYEKLESLDKSPLQIFYISGLIEHLTQLHLPGVCITGYDYPVKLERAPSNGLYNVCVNHRFFNYTLSDFTLTDKHITGLGYDLYVCGHDHMLYANVDVDGHIVQRPGSLMRGTSHSYNITREPSFDIDTFIFDGSKVTVQFDRVVLPHQLASEIFSVQALNKEKKPDRVEQAVISQQIDQLIAQMDKRTTNMSLYQIVDNIDMKEETRILIERYLTNNGLYREQVKENVTHG